MIIGTLAVFAAEAAAHARPAALLGLGAAAAWGGGDFSGGMGARYAGSGIKAALRVVMASHSIGLCVMLALAFSLDGMPHWSSALAWAMAAGVTAALALTPFYMALASGEMGPSAAIAGLLSALIPVAFALATEGLPGWLRLAGFAVAAVAIWMIAGRRNEHASRRTMLLAVAAGVGFGIYFIFLKMAGPAGLLWPMACVRLMSTGSSGIIYLMVVAGRKKLNHEGHEEHKERTKIETDHRGHGEKLEYTESASASAARFWRWSVLTACGDTVGNLLFLAATRAGRLDVAAVVASLYPASTILLAGWLLHERPTRRQALGMAAALAAVVLISL